MCLLLPLPLVSWVYCYLFLWCHGFVVTSSSCVMGILLPLPLVAWVCYPFLWCHGFVVTSFFVSWVCCYIFLWCNVFVVTSSSGVMGLFLAHLNRRLIVELIVYEGIRHPSVRHLSSVRLSTFSNDFSSEAVRPILFMFHI